MSNDRIAVWSRLRISWAIWPSRLTSSWETDSPCWRPYSVTASAMAVARQRFRVWNSPGVIPAAFSTASSVMAWQTSP
jgi:hypothetical protein